MQSGSHAAGPQVISTINGILQGPSKIHLSHRGELRVRNLASSMCAHIKFVTRKRLLRGQAPRSVVRPPVTQCTSGIRDRLSHPSSV